MSNQRLLSLDIFRGMTICLMIIVNTPGDPLHVFAPMTASSWEGFTPADLVFPSFLFAVGNSLSLTAPQWEKIAPPKVLLKITQRTLLLFILGFLLYWFPFNNSFDHTRIFGVLQRVALCYGIAAIVVHFMHERVVMILAGLILLIYWYISFHYGTPSAPYSLVGNSVTILDKFLIGENHMYHGEGFAFDPEGLLSTLPSIVNVLIGYRVGSFIKTQGKSFEGLALLFMWGAGFIFLSFMWNYQFPINKKLWSSSFALLTTGIDMVIIATLIYRVELNRQLQFSSFFENFGKNSLVSFVFSQLLMVSLYTLKMPNISESKEGLTLFAWLYQHSFGHFEPYWGSLGFAFAFMLVCWLPGYALNKYKLYIRL